LAGNVGGLDQLSAQGAVAGFAHWLAFAVGVAGFAGLGARPVKDLWAAAALRNRPGLPKQLGGSYRAEAGQAGGQSGRIDAGERGVADGFMVGALGFGPPQEPDFGGDFLDQVRQRDGGVLAQELECLLCGGAQRLFLSSPSLPRLSVPTRRSDRARPAASKARGSA
jgi:hypothetical protein